MSIIDPVTSQTTTTTSTVPEVAVVERHLIIMGCNDGGFWRRLKQTLESRITFDTSTCIVSLQDEKLAVDKILQRKRNNPQHDIHIVASLITRNHCSDEHKEHCPALNLGENYIDVLQLGVKGWFLEDAPDLVALGVIDRNETQTQTQIQSYELFPDNANGGLQVGKEFCRIAASIAPATVAVFYGPKEAAHSTARIDNFLLGLQEYCPEAQHKIKYRFNADWSSTKAAALLSPIFLRDGSVDAVIAANDDMALGALVAAREMRPDKQLLVGGYDANDYTIPLLQSGAMFATVDQIPPSGIGYSLEVMLSDYANGGVDFTKLEESVKQECGPTCAIDDYNIIQASAWEELTTKLPDKVSTAVAIRVKDASGLVLRERLQLYNPEVRPPKSGGGPTLVRAQLMDTTIFELYTEASSILAQGVLLLTWQDNRLGWDKTVYPDVKAIPVSSDSIWSPVVVLSNQLKTGSAFPLTDIKTTLYPDGTVVWEQRVNTGEFRCRSVEDSVFQFPFDIQNCGIDLTSYSTDDFVLFAKDGEDFEVEVANNDWIQGEDSIQYRGLYSGEEADNSSSTTSTTSIGFETVEYRVGMERDPLFIVLSIIVPSFLLNTISFAQHWIPTRAGSINLDRGGMAITTILAALALRDTMVAEVGNAFTFLDLFLLMSLVFQFLGFLITTYESSHQQVKKDNQDELGIGDRLGKIVTPILFGIICFILSLVWAGGRVWALFYLSIILIVVASILARGERRRMQRQVQQQVKARVSKAATSMNRTVRGLKTNFDESMRGGLTNSSPESVARFLRFQAVNKQKEYESKRGGMTSDDKKDLRASYRLAAAAEMSRRKLVIMEESSDDLGDESDEESFFEEGIVLAVEAENRAALTIQNFFREHHSTFRSKKISDGSTQQKYQLTPPTTTLLPPKTSFNDNDNNRGAANSFGSYKKQQQKKLVCGEDDLTSTADLATTSAGSTSSTSIEIPDGSPPCIEVSRRSSGISPSRDNNKKDAASMSSLKETQTQTQQEQQLQLQLQRIDDDKRKTMFCEDDIADFREIREAFSQSLRAYKDKDWCT